MSQTLEPETSSPPDPEHRASSRRATSRWALVWPTVLALTGLGLVVAAVVVAAPADAALLLLLLGVGVVATVVGLLDPVVAGFYLLATGFVRLATPDGILPVEPFILAFVGLIVSVEIWRGRQKLVTPGVGVLGLLVTLYVGWNVGSMLAPHEYGSDFPLIGGEVLTVWRFVLIGAAMPFIALLLGIVAFGSDRGVKMLLGAVMLFGGYSAFVSIMQFYGPAALVWPSYIISDPRWVGRAVGVANQPVVNGMILLLGYLAAVMVASHPTVRRWQRIGAGFLAASCCVGIYLTHTRVAWLAFVIVVLLGVVLARGWRSGFVLTLLAAAIGVAADWSSFTSSDRSEGGVGSASEIHDRLNMMATSFWAIQERPLLGWGIGRFPSVNTFHHQAWSPSIPWVRGNGYASHFDLLGIAVELGLIGAALWILTVLVVLVKLVAAVRTLPAGGLLDEKFGLFAVMLLLTLVVTGLTVDLRFFDVPNITVMMVAGAAIGRAAIVRRDRSTSAEHVA